ncbi:MAG: Cu(I)/Ag(I) efflux system membrane fusion protein [Phycisphaerales bacterium]|jgi:Cu(I)/Ag(I) efflux system membrane fusion protein
MTRKEETASPSKFIAALVWCWRHGAAGLTLVLIVAAFAVGFSLGDSGDETVSPSDADRAHAQGEPGKTEFYTCSMHPSVRLTDPKAKCPICHMDLIPVEDDGADTEGRRITIRETDGVGAAVQTTEARRFFPTAEVRLYGKVAFDETSVARLTAYFPGRIERLFVNYVGVPVNRDEHLAELYSPELLAASEELRQARASVAQSEPMSELMRESARGTLRSAREKLRLLGLTQAQIDEVENGLPATDTLTIYAPIGGVVTDLAAREGDYLETGDPIATVADLSRLWLDLEAYESQLPLLRWGQPVRFTVEAHPGETFEGRVAFIEPIVDARTRTAAVRVAVRNTERRLKPGMFASAVVRPVVSDHGVLGSSDLAGKWVCPMHPTEVQDEPGPCGICGMDLVPTESMGARAADATQTPPLVVPSSAVLFTGKRSVVYVRVPGAGPSVYEGREVVLGPRAGDAYTVVSGLDEGEAVVTHGAFRIDSAMQIQARPSMMSPEGGAPARQHRGANGAAAQPTEAAATEPPIIADSAVFAPTLTAYLRVQERLAGDDPEGFVAAAQALAAVVGSVEDSALDEAAEPIWRGVAETASAAPPAADLAAARVWFEPLSVAMITLQRASGGASGGSGGMAGGEPVYLVHCPMAFDFAGADWLQRGDTVNNPYFGDAMLRCGSITETFEPLTQGHDHE